HDRRPGRRRAADARTRREVNSMLRSAARQATGILQALRDERRSPSEVRALQERKLRAMVQHSWANSPFYRRKLREAGLSPTDIRTVADLVRLPPTTKRELQAVDPTDVVARGFSRENTFVEATSGSSGRVLQISHSLPAYDRYAAFAFRHLWDIGYRPWH